MAVVSLHIGVPKTATSYIQAWLHQNRRLLLRQGVYVPERPISAHRMAVEHLKGGIWNDRVDLKEIRKIPLDTTHQSIANALNSPGTSTVIISSEYYYYSNPAEVCVALQEQFGCDLNIIVYIRSQCPLVLSGYNQDVKRLAKAASRPAPQYWTLYDWSILLDAWAKQVGKNRVKVISFDVSARDGTILQDFIASSCPTISKEFSAGLFENVTYFNESLPADLLEFKRIANSWGELGLADFLEEALRSGYVGPAFGVNPEEARTWQALYEGSNRYVAREYFGASIEDVFPGSIHGKPGLDLEGRLPIESLAKLLALAIKRQQDHNKALDNRVRLLEMHIAELQKAASRKAQ